MCIVLLPPGVNPIAVNKYIKDIIVVVIIIIIEVVSGYARSFDRVPTAK
jgi:hypothetical protein